MMVMMPIEKLKPYKHNPRKIPKEAVDAVAESIKQYGFRGVIQIEKDGTIINGHTRLKAAKKLGIKELPCEVVDDLEAEQIRGYRLLDNKSAEYSSWDADLLQGELVGLDFGVLDFEFDFSGDLQKKQRWQHEAKRCGLKAAPACHKSLGTYYHSMFRVGKEGKTIEEIKTPEYVQVFADAAVDYMRMLSGGNLSECGWCLATTPRRRHAEGFHFATAVCERISEDLRVPFYPDMIGCKDRNRIVTDFSLGLYPREKNVLLYDDVITTGCTINSARDLLVGAGYTVLSLVSIDNRQ